MLAVHLWGWQEGSIPEMLEQGNKKLLTTPLHHQLSRPIWRSSHYNCKTTGGCRPAWRQKSTNASSARFQAQGIAPHLHDLYSFRERLLKTNMGHKGSATLTHCPSSYPHVPDS